MATPPDPTAVHYRSGNVPRGPKGIATRLFARLIQVADQDRVYRTDLPEVLEFPPSSTRHFTKGMAHYGIMIPDLPAPHHFMANMVLIGYSGFKAWDDDAAIRGAARRTITVGHGTAATTHDPYLVFGVDETSLAPDGSVLRFGKDYEITANYPYFHLHSSVADFHADLNLTATGEITWVGTSEIYKHLVLMCRYEGEIGLGDQRKSVAGLCTFEYGTGYLPYMELRKPLPPALKIPVDFFSYHVIDLDTESQLLLCVAGAFRNAAGAMAAELRIAGGGSSRHGTGTRFEVLEFGTEPTTYDGRSAMYLPKRFRWTMTGTDNGTDVLEGRVDTQWLYVGMGYIAGYEWAGTIRGETTIGRGYLEYCDRRG